MSPSLEFHTVAPCFWAFLGISLSNTDDLKFPPILSLCHNFVLFFILHSKNAPTISTGDYCYLVYDTI
jgi:hypothetical protein